MTSSGGTIFTMRHDFSAGFIRKFTYPIWTRLAHPAYRRYRQEFERNQYLSADELCDLQIRRLRQQLVAAYRYVPFYRYRMTEAGITPLDIRTHDDLKLLPALTKRDIQDYQDLLLASNIPDKERLRNQTGGSTGSPLQFWVDRERFDSRRASTDRHDSWTGRRPGDWFACLWGARLDLENRPPAAPDWRQQWLYRELAMNTSAVTDEALMQFVGLLRRYRPRHLLAYAQAAVMFSDFCRREKVEDIRFDSMILSAEMMLPGQREIVEETFGGKVFDRYGCREVSIIASECEHHAGLHINADALLVEVEPLPGLPSGMGRVLITDLLNRSMPLIRYEVGDLANLNPNECPCGRKLPLMGSVEGRFTDFLRLPGGRMVSGPSLTLVVADMRDVRQVQFLQSRSDQVILKVIPGQTYNALTEKELRKRMAPYLGPETELLIVLVDSIPSEPSGKYRFVKTTEDVETAALVGN